MLIKAEDETQAECVTPEAPEPQYKICVYCRCRLPIDQFRRRKTGSEARHTDCRSCRNRIGLEKAQARKRGKFKKYLTQLRRTRTRNEMEVTFALVLEALGGPQAFADLWHETLMRSKRKGPESCVRELGRFLEILAMTQTMPEPVDLTDVEDVDLDREFLAMVRRAEEQELSEGAWDDE